MNNPNPDYDYMTRGAKGAADAVPELPGLATMLESVRENLLAVKSHLDGITVRMNGPSPLAEVASGDKGRGLAQEARELQDLAEHLRNHAHAILTAL